MKTSNERILKVGFWFGMNTPTTLEDKIFIVEINFKGDGYSFGDFERDYELFKKNNPNPEIPYKDCIDNEECYIFFPEPAGIQITTINEIRLMALMFEKLDTKIYDLKKEKNKLKEEKREFIDGLVNNPDYSGMRKVSIEEIFTPLQVEMIEYLYNLSIRDNCSFQKLLEDFFETFKEELHKKNIHYGYLSYAVSHSLEQETGALSFAA